MRSQGLHRHVAPHWILLGATRATRRYSKGFSLKRTACQCEPPLASRLPQVVDRILCWAQWRHRWRPSIMSMQLLWRWWKPLRCVHVIAGCKVYFIPTAFRLLSCRPLLLRATYHVFVFIGLYIVHSSFLSLSLFSFFFSQSAVHDGKYRPYYLWLTHAAILETLAVACVYTLHIGEIANVCARWICWLKLFNLSLWSTRRDSWK